MVSPRRCHTLGKEAMSGHDWGLEGAVAVVTGAAGGIGAPLCEAFRGAGARVIGIDREEVADVADDFYAADLGDPRAIAEVTSVIRETHGDVRVLVNAAGIAREGGVLEAGPEHWDPVVDVNSRGLFLLSQEFARDMAECGYGKIINFASRCAYVGHPNFTSYNASKAAVVAITNTMAVELGALGVRVNGIAPGFIKTPMIEYALEDPQIRERLLSRIPMGRFGQPDDVNGLVLFLASPYSDYVNGVTVPLDGGMLIA